MKKYLILCIGITAVSIKFSKPIDVKSFTGINRGIRAVINAGRGVINAGLDVGRGIVNAGVRVFNRNVAEPENNLSVRQPIIDGSVLNQEQKLTRLNTRKEIKTLSTTPTTSTVNLPEMNVDAKKNLEELIKKYDNKWKIFFDKRKLKEQEAILLYTYRSRDINRKLWGNEHIKEIYFRNVDDIIKTLDRTIPKFKLEDDLIVYRGTDKKYFKDLKVGDEFSPGYYFSTSLSKHVANGFLNRNSNRLMMKIKVPKESKGLYVGKDSGWKYYKELILPRDTKYRVISFDGENMELEVIPKVSKN